ncbi:MAG: MAE_28990/MAE_18760 family HEPN-like nuclease [Nitrospira sp.]|nr:MAE_28990/MAE_18760 family HEPN-like nuclease [Nitrospira sp.]
MQEDFQTRVEQIEAYFAFIQALDNQTILLTRKDTEGPAYPTSHREDLLRTFKANLFLMLYNLMEATVKNAVESIFDELGRQGISFDSCRSEVKREVLSNLRNCHNKNHLRSRNVSDVLHLFQHFSTDAVTKTFQRTEVVSGNVDAREIRELADRYGFGKPAADGNLLLTVKTHRNDLAHGDKSFAEVGRDFDVPRLEEVKTKTIAYLSQFITNVTEYVTQQHYLASPDRP